MPLYKLPDDTYSSDGVDQSRWLEENQHRLLKDSYPDEVAAARALLLHVGALKLVDGELAVGDTDKEEAYIKGAVYLLAGHMKIEKWRRPRKEFWNVFYELWSQVDADTNPRNLREVARSRRSDE